MTVAVLLFSQGIEKGTLTRRSQEEDRDGTLTRPKQAWVSGYPDQT